jgi:hypothetical protein
MDHVHWEITPEAAQRTDIFDGGVQAKNSGDLFSRLSVLDGLLAGGDPREASDLRERQGYRNTGKEMAARFAQARSGRTTVADGTATGSKGDLQRYAISRFADFGWSESEASALIDLWQRESGWNPAAQNPTSTAYGIAQFLNGTWQGVGAAKTSDPYAQIDAGLKYIKGRFGSPSAALAFHQAKGWY